MADACCSCFCCVCSKPAIARFPNHCHLSNRCPSRTTNATSTACYNHSLFKHSLPQEISPVSEHVLTMWSLLSNYPFHPTLQVRSGRTCKTFLKVLQLPPSLENYSDKGKENQVVEQGGLMPVNGKEKMCEGCLQLVPTDVEYLKMKQHVIWNVQN